MKIFLVFLLAISLLVAACQTTGVVTVYACANGRMGDTLGYLDYGSTVASNGVFVPGFGYAVTTDTLTGYVYSLKDLKVTP